MKSTKVTPEKTTTTTASKSNVAPTASVAAVADKKPETPALKVAQPAAPVEPVAAAPVAKKAKPASSSAKKPAAAKPSVNAELSVAERVGLTAGSIWHYLSDNGPTSTAKLLAALDEEEKVIQRSIGWLAQEGKINIEIVGRVETISLKA